MCNIKLKVSEGDKNFELEMIDYDDSVLKYVIDKISDVFTNPQDEEAQPNWKAGYEALSTDKVGLHDPGSEYTIPTKKEEETSSEINEPLQDNSRPQSTPMFDRNDGKKQLYYICECGNKGKHFITPKREYVTCHVCPTKMKVRLANERGPEYKDEHGNFYIAGEYKKTMKDKEEETQFWKEFRTS